MRPRRRPLPDPAYGAVAPPIYQTSTFAFSDIGTNGGFDYTRSGNPTRARLEQAIAPLEGGSGATCTSSGMSAILVALNLLEHGSHVLCTEDCYGGTFRTLEHARRRLRPGRHLPGPGRPGRGAPPPCAPAPG